MGGTTSAQAAETYACAGNTIPLYTVDKSSGVVQSRALTSTGTTSVSVGAANTVSSNSLWKTYAKVFGGAKPSGTSLASKVYAIDNANSVEANRGLYVWTRSTSDGKLLGPAKVNTRLFDSWSSTNNTKISADSDGDIYTLFSDGILRYYDYDAANNAIGGVKYLVGGWAKYDLIVASAPGVVYARNRASGSLDRYRFDFRSGRQAEYRQVDSADWREALAVASPGADILVSSWKDGYLRHHRYDPVANTWPVRKNVANGGTFGTQTPIMATNWCTLTTLPTPVTTPSLPLVRNTAVGVMRTPGAQGSSGSVDFVFLNNYGELLKAKMPDEAARDVLTPPKVISTGNTFSGPPAIVPGAKIQFDISAVDRSGYVARALGAGATSETESFTWSDGLGLFKSPVQALSLSNKAVARFAVDDAGGLWVSEQIQRKDATSGSIVVVDATGMWRSLPAPSGKTFSGEVTTAALNSGRAVVVARATDGSILVANYNLATDVPDFGTWTVLPDLGWVGKPAVVVAPGDLVRVVAKDASGGIQTIAQESSTSWPTTWNSMGTLPVAAQGNPAVVMSGDVDKVVTVFVRGAGGSILATQEVSGNCGVFTDWWKVVDPDTGSIPLVADPTPYVITKDGAAEWGFVSYDATLKLTVYFRSSTSVPTPSTGCPSGSSSSQTLSKSSTSTESAPLEFERRVFPAPAN